jgi:transcriptional regulator with XRE-family HTH domain
LYYQYHEVSFKSVINESEEGEMALVRQEIGDVLRDFRLQKGHTLRQVAGRASVALGYLSEVERGQKEASSEILGSVAEALDVPLSIIMREVSDRLAVCESLLTASDLTGNVRIVSDLIVPVGFVEDFNVERENNLLGGRV